MRKVDVIFPNGRHTYDTDLPPQPMSPNEAILRDIVLYLQPKIIVEVGILFGQTTACLADALPPDGKIYGLDIDVNRARPYIDVWPRLWSKIILIGGNSSSSIPTLPDGIGFAYVDADHSGPAIQADIEALLPKMLDWGIMAFHDIDSGPVKSNVTKFFPKALFFDILGPGLALAQKVGGNPPSWWR